MFVEDCKFLRDYNVVLQKYELIEKSLKNKFIKIFQDKKSQDVMLNMWCMNPRVAFHEISKLCRSIILTSGTLSPMDSFSSELELKFDYTFEGSHVIDLKKQLLIGSVSTGPNHSKMNASFKESRSDKFQDGLGELLLQSCKNVEFGVLCFFPSYSMMEFLKKRWEQTGMLKKISEIKDLVFEGRGSESGENFNQEMNRFYKSIENYEKLISEGKKSKKTGALCFAVCRGKISEGIDFANNRARLVVS
jgi:fanconi anemia group J protein